MVNKNEQGKIDLEYFKFSNLMLYYFQIKLKCNEIFGCFPNSFAKILDFRPYKIFAIISSMESIYWDLVCHRIIWFIKVNVSNFCFQL